MPTIKDKLRFNYDGVWSDTYNLIHVVLDNGMFEESFGASREIIETEVKGSNKPLHHGFTESPLAFDMTIAFEDTWKDEDIDGIIMWLYKTSYKPLYFEGAEDKIFMCTPVDQPTIVHNGLKQGYFTIQMRCDSSNLYSPYVTTPLTTISTSSVITINSNSHYDVFPEISIKKTGAGVITIESLDDDGNIFEVRDLTNLEDIYINCEKEIIETDIVGMYRYDKVIGEFPRILHGVNRFKITGACQIQFRFKNKYRF
jgi:phage-related protein